MTQFILTDRQVALLSQLPAPVQFVLLLLYQVLLLHTNFIVLSSLVSLYSRNSDYYGCETLHFLVLQQTLNDAR